MVTGARIKAQLSLLFLCWIQFIHALHGYLWWLLFAALGPWLLCVPLTTTYGGAALVLWDDARGYQYTGEWARVLTAAFFGFFLSLAAISTYGLAMLTLLTLGVVR